MKKVLRRTSFHKQDVKKRMLTALLKFQNLAKLSKDVCKQTKQT